MRRTEISRVPTLLANYLPENIELDNCLLTNNALADFWKI